MSTQTTVMYDWDMRWSWYVMNEICYEWYILWLSYVMIEIWSFWYATCIGYGVLLALSVRVVPYRYPSRSPPIYAYVASFYEWFDGVIVSPTLIRCFLRLHWEPRCVPMDHRIVCVGEHNSYAILSYSILTES